MEFPVNPQLFVTYMGLMSAVAVAPGPTCFFCVATGMQQGRGAVLSAVAGVNAGTLIWFIMAAVGIGTLSRLYPGAFEILSYIGLFYLLWLSYEAFAEAFQEKLAPLDAGKVKRPIFISGILVQITNPKALLFYTALLPLFVNSEKPVVPQLSVYAAGLMLIDTIVMTAYGYGGAALRKRASDAGFRRGFSLATGLLLLTAAGLVAADKLKHF